MAKGPSVDRRILAEVALVALLTAAPVYAKHAGDVIVEIIFRGAIDTLTSGVATGPGPVPVPVPVPAEPEAIIKADPTVRLKGQELAYVALTVQPHEFKTRSFTRSLYTVVGGSAEDGSDIVDEDAVPDPALAVSEDLERAIALHYATHDAGPIPAPATAAAPAAATVGVPAAASVAASATPIPVASGFMLQVTTKYWELKAVSINPIHIGYGLHHYGVYYDAKFRLVDRKDGSILAEGKCAASPPTWGAPTLDEALADKGKRLKEMSVAAAHECALGIENDYLGIHIPDQS